MNKKRDAIWQFIVKYALSHGARRAQAPFVCLFLAQALQWQPEPLAGRPGERSRHASKADIKRCEDNAHHR